MVVGYSCFCGVQISSLCSWDLRVLDVFRVKERGSAKGAIAAIAITAQ